MDIPKELHNSETDAPFQRCMSCDRDLLDGEVEYFVERIFRTVPDLDITEALFEYAMCMPCAESFRDQMSKESRERIEAYFIEGVQRNRWKTLDEDGNTLGTCILTGKSISECSEYSYHAYCKGDQLMEVAAPYAVSDLAMDEISELLSAETADELDDFKGKYFTGPPELADLINPKRLIPL